MKLKISNDTIALCRLRVAACGCTAGTFTW